MKQIKEMAPEIIRERLVQANEMSDIWDRSPEAIQMYLKGCIVTAAALAGIQPEGPRKAG